MDSREPPETAEGWYALHDFRRIDWSAWRSAPARVRERALRAGVEYLQDTADPETGESAVVSITGHKADLLVMQFRPTLDELNALERQFERTAFAEFTERTTSYVSVAEASGYNVDLAAALSGEAETGLQRYIQSRLEPTVPDADYVCFYPMDKRREPEQNWYDLSFEERAEHMAAHGEIGKDYAGQVSQVVTSSIGLDDWEWGVTLFAQDAAQIKRLLYEMRFDPSSSRFAEFGPFYVGQLIAPTDLRPLLAGETVSGDETATADREGDVSPGGSADAAAGERTREDDGVRDELADAGVYAGKPRGEEVHAVVVYSEADPGALSEAVDDLRSNFEHYGSHRKTAVYEHRSDESLSAVASVWETESAADTAGGFLSDLPGVVRQAGDGDGDDDTWGTMGMFYTVETGAREAFHEKFDEVLAVLDDHDGHRKTDLMVNRDRPTDMFIASRWESRDDATEFFRGEAFAETVDWGRDVLADRPRHVFLA